MHSAHTVILGKNLEARASGDFVRSVLINGREAGQVYTCAWFISNASVHLDLEVESGKKHHIEVIFISRTFSIEARVLIDGELAETLKLRSEAVPDRVCRHCAYPLKGLPVNNGEIACPECGRHNAVAD